ncbi:MAG: UxaA family hydrolase [Dehalococcoidales bacterium]|nr:UxaA family hydrolase [Dehalococcoidales bacterium]
MKKETTKFLGYERPDGSVGVRNSVAIISGGNCSNELAATISNQVKGSVPLLPDFVCVRFKDDNERALRTMIGLGANPNVAAAVVVGIGCEHIGMEEIYEGIKKSKKPVEFVTVLDSDGYEPALEKGLAAARRMATEASQMQRQPFDLSHLSIGLKCGASNATSGIVGNPATGIVVDRIIAEGGTVIFSETTEMIGAAHLIAKRAINKRVARQLTEAVDRMEARIKATGEDVRGSQPTPANIQGGLTTLEEKSLGNIEKTGKAPLQGVLENAERPQGKGLYFMDGSAQTSELVVAEAASGNQIHIMNVGGGISSSFRGCLVSWSGGLQTLPVITVVSNRSRPKDPREEEFFDIFADSIIDGKETITQVAERLFQEVIAVASGKLTRSERYVPHFQMPLEMYHTGPIL